MSQPEGRKLEDGWRFPYASQKAHYFEGITSLCGKWMFLGETQAGADAPPSPDDCAACRRKLDKLNGVPR